MKFVLTFICLVASVASMKGKHFIVETYDENGTGVQEEEQGKYQDGSDYSEGYGPSKYREEEKYGSGKKYKSETSYGSGKKSRNRRCIGSDDSHGTSSQCGGGDSHEVEDKDFKPCKSYKKKRMRKMYSLKS